MLYKRYIDEKYTVWRRRYVIDDVERSSIIDHINEDELSNITEFDEELYDTIETLSVEENNNNPTIELFENEELIWDNKNGFVNKNNNE